MTLQPENPMPTVAALTSPFAPFSPLRHRGSLLAAPMHRRLRVGFIAFETVRARCRALRIGPDMTVVVRGRADTMLLLEIEEAGLVAIDRSAARFIEVVFAVEGETRAA